MFVSNGNRNIGLFFLSAQSVGAFRNTVPVATNFCFSFEEINLFQRNELGLLPLIWHVAYDFFRRALLGHQS